MAFVRVVAFPLVAFVLLAAASPAAAEPAYESVKLEDFEANGFDLLGRHVEILGDYSSLLPISPSTAANIVDPRMSLGRKALSDPALRKELRGVDPAKLPRVALDLSQTPQATFQWFLKNGCREQCEGVYFRGLVAKHRVNQMPALLLMDASHASLARAEAGEQAAPQAGSGGDAGAGAGGGASAAAGGKAGTAPAAGSEAGAAVLFAKGAGDLSPAEQGEIYTLLGLTLAPDGKTLLDPACQQPIGSEVSFEDLNGDGTQEVFVIYGNGCMSGGTGSSIVLLRKGPDGRFRIGLGFPAAGYTILATKSRGYPDLQIGGMGFCEPIWRWDGKDYQHHRNQPTAKDGCLHVDGTRGGP